MKITLLVDEAISCEDCYDSELLQKLQEEGTAEYSLPEFAGGAPLLRNVLKQLASLPEESAVEEGERPLKLLDVTPASLGDFLEAAATLRSPRFLRLLVLGQELQSRQALPFLEQVVRLSGRSTDISEKMDEAFVKVANFFCSRLDYQDLRLGDALAQGSLKVSLEVLRCHRQDFPPGPPSPPRDGSRPGTATPSVAAGYSVQGEHRRATLEWSQHKFAATVFQRHLRLEAEAAKAAGCARVAPFLRQPDALVLGMESEEEAEAVPAEHLEDNVSEIANLVSMDVVEDLEEELVDSVPDDRIKRLAALAEFLDAAATPPITAAAVVRSSLGHQDAAVLFRDFFCTSKKLRWMVVTGEVPSEFLHEVAWHPAASLALRRMLARYQDAQPDDLCRLIQDLLFDHLLDEAHSYQLILKHPLTEKLILWLYNGGGSSAVSSQQVAEELFQVSFIPQGGFLCQDEASTSPWDGGLDPKLLGKVPRTEDSLFLARKVLLRHFLPPSRLKGTTPEDYPGFVHEMARLWPLGSWKQCRDQEMIREAFKFLARCWKALASLPGLGDLQGCSCIQRTEHEGVLLVGAGSRRRAEELLLQMFSDLEVWRLPPADLLTPWVPGQVLAAHVTAQCKELEDRLVSLVDETRENLEELSRLTSVMSGGQPTSMWQRLEATDQRSTQFMQKQAELNNTLRQLQ